MTWVVVYNNYKFWDLFFQTEASIFLRTSPLFVYFILLTHEGSHREVYREFQPSQRIPLCRYRSVCNVYNLQFCLMYAIALFLVLDPWLLFYF